MANVIIDSYGQPMKNGKPYRPKDWKGIFKSIGKWIVDKLLLPIVIPILVTIITNNYMMD